MSKRRRIPIDPNDTSDFDPQFGNVEDLPRGVKRQTSLCVLDKVWNEDSPTWSRLVIKFPECLGIEETLKTKAESTKCIPSLNMDIPINLPVIKDVKLDLILSPPDYTSQIQLDGAKDGVRLKKKPNNLAFILTGDDQITTKAPSTTDEEKEESVEDVAQAAAISDAIWTRFYRVPNAPDITNYSTALKPAGVSFDNYWLYGKEVGGISGLSYGQVAEHFLGKIEGQGADSFRTVFEQNNIQAKGFLLLKDHVNMFVKVNHDGSTNAPLQFRIIVDYTIREVSLSSLLVWRQQLKEFLPKQVQWRVYKQALDKTNKKNGWNILVSRGTIEENGAGVDPSSKTQFPDIDD